MTREAHFACGLLKQLPEVSIARVAGYEAYRYLSGTKFINRLISIPMRNFYNRSKYVVTPSKATRELYVNANIPDTKIRVVYNGIDSEFISNRRNEDKIEKIRRNFGITK